MGFSIAAVPEGSGNGWIGDWTPGVGDPTVIGWGTTAAYLAAAVLALGLARRAPTPLPAARRERWLWWSLAVGFFALGFNKQLDLQTALTEVGRMMAKDEGWYDERRLVQAGFVVLLFLACLALVVALFVLARETSREVRIAIVGAALLCAFVVLRAATFHHLDLLIGSRFARIVVRLLELGGIAIVLIAGYQRRRSLDGVRPPRAGSRRAG